MNRWVTLFIFVLSFISPCSFCQAGISFNVVFNQPYPPGSIVIQYGGFEGLIRNQLTSQFHNLHREYLQIYFSDRPLESCRQLTLMRDLQADIDNGGAWYTRTWWDLYPESQGGAPREQIFQIRGRRTNILDLGFVYVTNDFRFKLKEFDISISEILFSTSLEIHDWCLRIKPSLRFSIKEIISRAQVSVFFDYIYRHVRHLSIQLYLSYHPAERERVVGINIFFLRW